MSWWVNGGGVRMPVLGSARARAWAAMRRFEQRRAGFTVADLRLVLQDEPGVLERRRRGNVSTYVTHLARAGYLRLSSGGRENVWRLARDTGPLPPVMLKSGGVFDPNTKEFLPADLGASGAEAEART